MCDDVADSGGRGHGHLTPDTHSRQIVVVNKDVDQGKPFKVTDINLLYGYSRIQHLKMSPLGPALEVHKRRLLLEEGGGRQEGGVDRDLRAELGDNLHLGELPLKWLLVYLQTSMAQSSAWRQWYAVSNDKLTQKPS